MKKFSAEDIRTVVIAGGGGAGKTSMAEAMIFTAGAGNRLGLVDDGSSVLDYDADEVARKISLGSSLAVLEWKKKKIHLIDTPGYANFLTDAYAAIRVADAAVIVVSVLDGPKVETEKVWKQADQAGLPRLIYFAKTDKERADFEKTLEQINKLAEGKAVPLLVPHGVGESFMGLVDLISQKVAKPAGDGSWKQVEPDEAQKEILDSWREKLMEKVAESRDDLLEKYLETGTMSQDELVSGLAAAVKGGLIYPVLAGASVKGGGAAETLEAIINYLPSPVERGAVVGAKPGSGDAQNREPSETAPFSAMVFKTVADPYAGRLTLFRVYSGTLRADTSFYNSSKESKERIGQLFFLVGKNQIPTTEAVPGDVVAVAKLKETTTGDTISDEKAPVLYPFVQLPKAAISFAIEPKSKGDDEKVGAALHRLAEEDPALQVGRDPQTKEMIISGLGQLHLEVILGKLKRKFGVEVIMHEPKIPYKETIKGRTKVQGRHKKQTGGRGQFGDCWLEIEPLTRGSGFEFVDKIFGGSIPRQFIPAVEKGVVEAMINGPLAGYPVVDLRVTVYDGSFHTVDSSELAFKLAGRKGFRKGMLECKPVLLEPIMNAEITVPDEYMGDIIGDLNSRRGRVSGVDASSGGQIIKAKVPMAEMLKYSNDLRSMTQGRGSFDMEFDHYEEVPGQLAEKVIAQHKKEAAEEEDE